MKIYVIGTRGFPRVQGGVEKHCELLYPLLSNKGCDVTVFRRKAYVNELNSAKSYGGVSFCDLFSTRNKNIEAVFHSFVAAFICVYRRPDIVHIHNIGPSLVLPLLKIFKLKSVVTYHSANYEHAKWGWLAQKLLKLGEYLTFRLADSIIFISRSKYRDHLSKKSRFVVNGVNIPNKAKNKTFVNSMNLEAGKYILSVSRLSSEKGLDLLIKAYKKSSVGYPLVIVGGSDNQPEYGRKLKSLAADDERIKFTGYIIGSELNEVYTHAGFFVLPSYNEGLPIAVLEAMSYGLPTLVSDIQANQDLDLPAEFYFKCGDLDHLRNKLEAFEQKLSKQLNGKDIEKIVYRKYNWSSIAEKTMTIYSEVCGC